MTDIADAVRAWARGMYPTEAGVELLIRQGKAIYDGAPWITRHGDERASIDADKLLDESGAWSGGEQRIAEIAASLLGGEPVMLADVVPGLDRTNLDLVLAAIAHAGGSHEHHTSPFMQNPDGSVVVDDDNNLILRPDRGRRLPSLYSWPGNFEARRRAESCIRDE